MFHGTPDDDFFSLNREMKYVPEVEDLIKCYGPEKAGKYMWAMWLVLHPGSTLFELDQDDKIDWIRTTYLNDPDFEWPTEEIVVIEKPRKKKPAKRGRRKKDEDFDEDFEEDEEDDDTSFEIDININGKDFRGLKDTDFRFEFTGVHEAFYRVIKIFPDIAMSYEERNYFGLVRLLDIARLRAEYLNGKDLAAAIKQIASSSAELDKMKEKYLTWKEAGGQKSSGDVQSGWASKMKRT